MNAVAIHDLKDDRESRAPALARAMEATVYEASARLRSPGSGPFILAVFAEEERAALLVERLRTEGFVPVLLRQGDIEDEARARTVRRFTLGVQALDVADETGDSLPLRFGDVDVILRGMGIASDTTTETVKERSFGLGRAVLTGGLVTSRTRKSVREVTTEDREGFMRLYAADGPPLLFRENVLSYESLGPRSRPSRAANFACLVDELRKLCPSAAYDERLLTRPGQAALLGPLLRPDEHLTVATALLAKVLRSSA